ncbi:D-alanyl-D-alanine carboxypeptidase [Patescibacteria group bacterium]|nr:D-alanyl-D-alanine carboxypeptidase [Patescibacteria group bacterium]MBU1256342.1 D-alanyl-D-alanine carboxypeptidase [Patescibacteria group bacterium]MBU1457189.1 D-alanyl-D-alanine carboxypeptidase [Patescibacteria group bacterium]
MKFFKTTLLLLAILFPLVPQYQKRDLPTTPEVKSAFIHQASVPSFLRKQESIPIFSAKSVYILDLTSNTTLYQKNSTEPLFPASLTKVMTAVVALDHYQIDQILTVKSADHSIGNTMNLKPGDRLTTIDLIYGLLVASGNDAALALAENFPGGYSQFIVAMNKKAERLNLKQTHFNNVSGVEDVGHFSSAQDLSQLTQFALKNVTFRQAVSTKYKEITSVNGNQYPLTSTNELLGVVPGVLGVKTGWTPEAGECLITLVNQDNRPILITVLGSEDRFGKTKQIISWVYNSFSW